MLHYLHDYQFVLNDPLQLEDTMTASKLGRRMAQRPHQANVEVKREKDYWSVYRVTWAHSVRGREVRGRKLLACYPTEQEAELAARTESRVRTSHDQ